MEPYIKRLLLFVKELNGFYIEAGSNDGIIQSYTYELEKLGWNGLLIEPSVSAFESCVVNRPNNKFINCALVASEDVKEITGDFDGWLMSSVRGERSGRAADITVKSRTLNSILEELNIKDIDLFSLDVEGYELEVLKGLDLSRCHPKYVIIEVYDKIKDDIFSLMTENNYEIIDNLTGYNLAEYPHWDGTCNDYLFKRL